MIIKSRNSCSFDRIVDLIKSEMKLDNIQVYELIDSQINREITDLNIEQMIELDGLVFVYEIPSEPHCFYNLYDSKISLVSYPRIVELDQSYNNQQIKSEICRTFSQLNHDDIELYYEQGQDICKIINED